MACVYYPYNVCIKYREEYDDAMRGCGIKDAPQMETMCRGEWPACHCDTPGGCGQVLLHAGDRQRLASGLP